MRDRGTDRAVSTTFGYVLTLAITAVLVSGLLVGTGQYVDGRREQVADRELSVLAERIAARTADADRMARADGGADSARVRVSVGLPRTVAGASYRIEVDDAATPQTTPPTYDITLTAAGRSVTVAVRTGVDVESGTLSGGPLLVVYDPGTGTLSFESGDDVSPSVGPPLLASPTPRFASPATAARGGGG